MIFPERSSLSPAKMESEQTKTAAFIAFGNLFLKEDFPPSLLINLMVEISISLSIGFNISYIVSATIEAPCMASTSTPVL
ncbi:hypothetical protein D3C87_1512090 [compost metagenome]